MIEFTWLIPTLPFAGFLILVLAGRRLPRALVPVIGAGSVGLAAVITILIAINFASSPPPGNAFVQTLWTWMAIGDFTPGISFYVDALSLVMSLVVTFVGFLIHVYSAEFMEDDEGYSRFFAYMNLFVGSMLTLLLAQNLLLLYLGWEGVGLCSYLLIGFWYKDPVNGRAARKAFIVTRVGDTVMILALFILFLQLRTLDIQELMQRASASWPVSSGLAIAVAAFLLGGAVGKSAQLPLQTWLPDAMAGPTPVSALIHAATMVTAGVYLIARTHVLFALAPPVQLAVGIIGAATLVMAGFSALTQYDIKRVLAYSTISQIGYMFLALGVGAWSAAIFHFMTHAFFKALLFLAAGAVILAMHHEHNMFKMGGLRKQMPVTFWTFLIGAASLAALPLVTAGFYSKDLILWEAWSSPTGSRWLWAAGLVGALLTGLYTFRMVFITFFGELKHPVAKKPGMRILVPLIVLAALSVIGGFVELPPTLGDWPMFSKIMATALPTSEPTHTAPGSEGLMQAVAAVVSLAGILLAYLIFLRRPQVADQVVASSPTKAVHRFWFLGWGWDALYDTLFVRPYQWLARVNSRDPVDLVYVAIAWLARIANWTLSLSQTGNLRWYAGGIALGAIILVALAVFS